MLTFKNSRASIAINKTESAGTSVKASIPYGPNNILSSYWTTLFGYTSPGAKVRLLGVNTDHQVTADSNGYFEFKEIILPSRLKDACLIATDTEGKTTPPSCLSLPNLNQKNSNIGAILMAPTISLKDPNPEPDTTQIVIGQSIPNQELKLVLYSTHKNNLIFPKKVEAAAPPPQITTTTDKFGHYSFTTPTTFATSYRLTTQAFYDQRPSPPSFILKYDLPSLIISNFINFPIILPLLLFQVFAIAFLLFAKKRLKKHFWPALYPKSLSVQKNKLWQPS